jgi:hypothetical protein
MNRDERGNLDLLAASSSFKEFATRSEMLSRVARILVTVFALSVLAAQSQPPPPVPGKEGQPKQQEGTGKEGKTEDHKTAAQPITVTVINSPEVQDRTAHQNRDSSPDWWIRLLTAVIAAATVMQAYIYWRQKALMRDALAETKKAADAAKASADALMNSERAWLVARPVEIAPNIYTLPNAGQVMRNAFACRIWNAGKTPAKLMRSAMKYVRVKSLSDLPVATIDPAASIDGGTLVPTEASAQMGLVLVAYLEPDVFVTPEELMELRQQKMFLYAYGVVEYEDAFKRSQTIPLGFAYHFPMGGDPRPEGFYWFLPNASQ